jgi:RimJ/RimL family protein N-acetyltransferase
MTVQEQGNRQPVLPTLETERLLLRQWSLADLDAIMTMNADPAVYRYLDEPEEPAAERALTRERILTRYPQGLGAWSIFARAEPATFLGYVHLIPIDDRGPDIEIGFRLTRATWGRGIAQEAAARAIAHGFEALRLKEIVAVIDPDNQRSRGLLVRLGFRRAGWRRAWGYDNHFFRLTGGRWRGLRA